MFWKVIATFALKQCIKLSFVSRLSRDTRGRRRIIAFLFLYPRRDMYMKFPLHFMTFCFLKSYCYFCPKAMYQVILRPRLSRDTRGRRRIIAFLFLYPRRDVHEVSVSLYNFLCFEKLLLSLQRERCGFSHVGVFKKTCRLWNLQCRFFIFPHLLPLLLFFLSAAGVWACTLHHT